MYSTNMRKYFPTLFPTPYIRNGARGIVFPSIPISSIHSLSLGELALIVRRTLQAELTREATEDYLRWRLAKENAGKPTVFMEPLGYWHVISNWRDMVRLLRGCFTYSRFIWFRRNLCMSTSLRQL